MRLRVIYADHVRSHLPPAAQSFLHLVARRYDLWRLRPIPTELFGPKWSRARDTATLDITWVCDLNCFNCNRSCSQDPTGEHMSVGQVRRFLEESKERGIRWRRIRVAGGEPTCHPQFLEIMELIKRYRDHFSPETAVIVITNGYSDRAKRSVSRLPAGVRVLDTAKSGRQQPSFYTHNVAPIDVSEYKQADFSNACDNPAACGLGVTPYGYYPCSVAGAIDRTFGFDLGRKAIPQDLDGMKAELRTFCALCGRFKLALEPRHDPLEGPVMSKAWEEAYERSRRSPARLSRLPEWMDPSRPDGSVP